MAFKSMNHDDEKIFYNRLWKLMEERNLSTARELAQALYAEEIVPVDSASEDEISIIGSMTRRIQEHLNLEGTDKLQGKSSISLLTDFSDNPVASQNLITSGFSLLIEDKPNR